MRMENVTSAFVEAEAELNGHASDDETALKNHRAISSLLMMAKWKDTIPKAMAIMSTLVLLKRLGNLGYRSASRVLVDWSVGKKRINCICNVGACQNR